jgi:hypothetical protein
MAGQKAERETRDVPLGAALVPEAPVHVVKYDRGKTGS